MAAKAGSKTIAKGLWDIQGAAIPYRIVAEPRNNIRYALSGRQAIMRVPYGYSVSELNDQVRKFYQWVIQAQSKRPQLQPPEAALQQIAVGQRWQFGRYVFRIQDLNVTATKGASISVDKRFAVDPSLLRSTDDITLELPMKVNLPEGVSGAAGANLLQRLFFKQLSGVAFPYVQRLVEEVDSQHFKVWNGQLKLSYMSSRWGSCSGKGNISLSTKLLAAPEQVLRAVIVHELAHVLEHNHSQAFWDIVYRVMPDYAESDRWLRQEASSLVWGMLDT